MLATNRVKASTWKLTDRKKGVRALTVSIFSKKEKWRGSNLSSGVTADWVAVELEGKSWQLQGKLGHRHASGELQTGENPKAER